MSTNQSTPAKKPVRVADPQAPRTIFMESCAAIAAAFEPLGYRFKKSGPRMVAQSRDRQFSYEISFSSSVHIRH
jgi:hypothetical protein